jgi:hypothetical protein
VHLPAGDADEFVQLALRHGVAVLGGAAHHVDGDGQDRLRIAFSQPHEVLVEGVRRLGRAWDEYCAAAPPLPSGDRSPGDVVDLRTRLVPVPTGPPPRAEARQHEQ